MEGKRIVTGIMSPIKYKEETSHLLKSVQKQKVAVMRCKAYQSGNSSVNTGNRLADKTAKEVEKGIIVLKPKKTFCPRTKINL